MSVATRNPFAVLDVDGERREGRGRGRGGNRGGRGRTFDRHSATGKTDSDKKVHNSWGGDDGNAELKTEEAATNDVVAESGTLNDWAGGAGDGAGDGAGASADWGAPAASAGADWGAPAADAADGAPVADGEKPDGGRRKEREGEEEDNTLTFDQYQAQQKEKESALVPKLEVRKANDGADDNIWDGATRLEKGDAEAYFTGKTKSAPKGRTEKKEKVFIEIDARFERPPRGGRGRGGDRGEARGRGGRDRGGRGRGRANGTPSTPVVSVDDETAFPSLS
ncbi:hypothetical protein PAXRUDRAFT_422701 [Paxillus rubicundulus Ve08.2h10]|uniref:Hyaluronan/mRNA-binding protein domain-containing protein n=1 Tax=Paxillus rubicundulus Ve08.2h10 TaxID=930991 RepID=A0A0D0DQN8_9AGAM|nr:hypothetical protein PAXRUDRAFT_422701 [Paxillus rubicundulus Ve08.2h10]